MKALDVFGAFRGQEYHLLAKFMDAKLLSGKHVDCPICEGKKKMRYCGHEYGGGRFVCTTCFPELTQWPGFLKEYLQCSFAEVRERVKPYIPEGGRRMTECDVQQQINAAAQRANEHLLKSAKMIEAGSVFAMYLESRGINPELFVGHKEVLCGYIDYFYDVEGQKQKERVADIPALLLRVRDKAGKLSTMHRIFLNVDGSSKYETPDGGNAKLDMPTVRPYTGGGVWLRCPTEETDTVLVGEGFENTALCMSQDAPVSEAYHDSNVAVVCTLKANMLQKFEPPERYKRVLIVGDNDRTGTGQVAAWSLYRSAQIKKLDCPEPVIPGHFHDPYFVGKDVCDVYGAHNG